MRWTRGGDRARSGQANLTRESPSRRLSWRVAARVGGILLAASVALGSELASEGAAAATGCGGTLLGSTTVETLNGVPFLTVSANGRPVTLLLDTGAQLTTLVPDAASRIGAQPPRIELPHQLRGLAGTLGTREVELGRFAAGGVTLPWRRVLVAPITTGRGASGPLDGLIGADVLSDFDLDLDLPHRRLGFYEKQTCPDAAPDWPGRSTVIPTARSLANHLTVAVQLDGRRLVAIVDTGAQRTTLATSAARGLGVSAAMLARDRSATTRGAAGEQLTSRLHRFASLAIGRDVVRDPELIVTDFALETIDMVIGMDVLGSRRLWLSYGSHRVFLADP